jgi:hypothetical protein
MFPYKILVLKSQWHEIIILFSPALLLHLQEVTNLSLLTTHSNPGSHLQGGAANRMIKISCAEKTGSGNRIQLTRLQIAYYRMLLETILVLPCMIKNLFCF